MTCILLPDDKPYYNLAAEEFFLKNSEEDLLLLYINKPSVIVGRHQNLFAEINYSYLRKNGILFARRLTGGGTVYHDHGNLNFAFIENGTTGSLANQKKYTEIIIRALAGFHINAKAGPRNEITIDDKKISGCAEHIYKNRVLHHGTLLFSSDLDNLIQSLTPVAGYSDRAVKSIRSSVTNISEHLQDKNLSISVFKKEFAAILLKTGIIGFIRNPKISEAKEIEKIERCKYSTWEWNVAYSPRYKIEKTIQLKEGSVFISADIEGGIFTKIILESKEYSLDMLHQIEESLCGQKTNEEDLKEALSDFTALIETDILIENLL